MHSNNYNRCPTLVYLQTQLWSVFRSLSLSCMWHKERRDVGGALPGARVWVLVRSRVQRMIESPQLSPWACLHFSSSELAWLVFIRSLSIGATWSKQIWIRSVWSDHVAVRTCVDVYLSTRENDRSKRLVCVVWSFINVLSYCLFKLASFGMYPRYDDKLQFHSLIWTHLPL